MKMLLKMLSFAFVAIVCVSNADEGWDFSPFDAMEPTERLKEQRAGNDSLLDALLAHSLRDVRPLHTLQQQPYENVTDSCQSILNHFADQAANFTRCLLSHARPFRLCEKCVGHYTKATNLYTDLVHDEKCSSVLLLADRMQVMTSTYESFVSLWDAADCGKCFDYVEENSTTGNVTYSFTVDTSEFQSRYKNISACFNSTDGNLLDGGNATQCTLCLDIYHQLNTQFEHMRGASGGHVCMDLVDMMNYTRLMWSSKFGCQRPSADTKFVIILTVMLGFFTVILYLGSRFSAKIRMPEIFKAKRMMNVTKYGSVRQGQGDVRDSATGFASPASASYSSSSGLVST